MTKIGMRLVLLITMIATVGCDRVTKHLASGMLPGTSGRSLLADTIRFAYAENAGGFLSLGADWPDPLRVILFTGATGLMLLVVALVGIRLRVTGWPAFGISLLLAGGASNWFDRALRGSVVDFLNVGVGNLRTGIFNFADVAIMVGAAICIASQLRHEEDRSHSPSECA
jgi:signal peptidase II